MAFLKSSRITGITARDVAVRGFRQSNNIKLGTRAYTRHEVLLADSYDIVGDVTVSDNLILSKLSDDGNAITITGDTSTRTISGSGSIEGATLAQTPNADMTGMTGTLGTGVTGGTGLTSIPAASLTGGIDRARFPSGTIIKHQQYMSKTAQDFSGTSEAVWTPIGNPMVFVKLKDSSESKLTFISYGKMFDAAGQSFSLGIKLRRGTNTSGTLIGDCDAYDLFHSNSTPHRTGREINMYTDEMTAVGAGTENFVITGQRYGYSDPVAINAWQVHIFEILK